MRRLALLIGKILPSSTDHDNPKLEKYLTMIILSVICMNHLAINNDIILAILTDFFIH